MTSRPSRRIPKAIWTALRAHNVVGMADMCLARDAAVEPCEDTHEDAGVLSIGAESEKAPVPARDP